MKKIYILIFILLFPFILFLYILHVPKNYTINYEIKDYKITEIYVKDIEVYKFFINYKNNIYPILIKDSYNENRKLISNIKIEKECLNILIKDIEYPVCYKNNILIDHNLIFQESIKTEKVIQEFNKNKIYNYNNSRYYIWNYMGYDYLNENDNRSINIINKDEYNNNLSYQYKNYLITPNYDNNYYFTELLVIDNNTSELTKIDLKTEVSYSSRFLGNYKNSIYLLDEKNKIQYKINIKKAEVKIIGTENKDGVLYHDNKTEYISLKKIINNNLEFTHKTAYKYKIIDNKLYFIIDNYKILVSNNFITDIVKIDDSQVYYLSKNVLYSYSPAYGEIKLLENNEWNFNYKNKIFIFN